MPMAACYSMDLYCEYVANGVNVEGEKDNIGHFWKQFPDQYTGPNYSDCAKQAQKNGWALDRRKGLAVCPKCVKRLKETGCGPFESLE